MKKPYKLFTFPGFHGLSEISDREVYPFFIKVKRMATYKCHVCKIDYPGNAPKPTVDIVVFVDGNARENMRTYCDKCTAVILDLLLEHGLYAPDS